MPKKDDIRGTFTVKPAPTFLYGVALREVNGADPQYPYYMQPTKKRTRERQVTAVRCYPDKYVIVAREPDGWTKEYTQGQVKPECWKQIITPALKRKLKPPRVHDVKGYRVSEKVCLIPSKVKKTRGKWKLNGEYITLNRLCKIAQAILEDNGYEVNKK